MNTKNISISNAAIIAGIGLLLMAIIAPIANFGILEKLVIPGDSAKTVENIVSSGGTFRMSIFIFLIVAILDIIVAWALYIFLAPVNKGLSLLTAWIRIVYASVLAFVIIYLINVLQLLKVAEYSAVFGTEELNALIMLSIDNFRLGWETSLIIFGFHLLILGYLFFKAGYMKKALGILLLIAGLGYIIDGTGKLLSDNYTLTISAFTFIGEVILIFWLLIQGRKIKE